MDAGTMRRRVDASRVGHLATAGSDGQPHIVPVCFALDGDTAYTAVDHKRKSGKPLRRIANVEATGRACLLVDEYNEDWMRLWWVRLDGAARIVESATERAAAIGRLVAKYPQYRTRVPVGPVLALDVTRWSWWAATGESEAP